MLLNITKSNFESETKDGIAIIDFYADWCGPCKAVAPILQKLSKEFEGKLKIFKLNIDENQELASQFGIRSIPTFIAFKDGKKFDMKVGGMRENEFKEWFNSLTNGSEG